MPQWRTRRQRTLVMEGDFQCKAASQFEKVDHWPDGTPMAYAEVFQIGAQASGCIIQGLGCQWFARIDGYVPADQDAYDDAFFTARPLMDASCPALGLNISFIGPTVVVGPPALSIDAVFNGHWKVECDVEERFFPYTPSNSTTIDGVDFRYEGTWTAQSDGLPNRGGLWYERYRVGGKLILTATFNGETHTATHTFTGSEVFDVGYNIYRYLECQGYMGSTDTFCTAFVNGIPYTYTRSGSHTSGDGLTVTTFSTGAGGAYLSHTDSHNRYLYPPYIGSQLSLSMELGGKYSLDAHVRSVDLTPKPGIKVVWNHGELDGPDVSTVYQQYLYEVVARQFESSFDAFSHNDIGAIRTWLKVSDLTSSGDDVRDPRMQIQFYPWRVSTINQDSSHVVGSGGTITSGSTTIAITEPIWEGYRYLRFVATPSGFSNRNMSVSIGSKNYSFRIGSGATTVTIDLRSPSNIPSGFEKDIRQSRFPLSILSGPYGPDRGKPDITSGTDEEKGWLWGLLDRPTSVSVSGVGDGESLSIGIMSLTRLDYAWVGVMLPFKREKKGWTSPTDTTYLDLDFPIWCDGKCVSDWPGRAHVVPTSGSASFTYYSFNQIRGFIQSIPGWYMDPPVTNTESPSDVADPTSYYLGGWTEFGNADPYIHTGLSWRPQVHMNISANLYACMKLDEVQTYPGCGDPRLPYGGTNDRTPIRTSKVIRGKSDALVLRNTDGQPWQGALVDLVLDPGLTESGGSGTTDSRGNTSTGYPWAKGHKQYRVRSGTLYWDNQYIENRSGLRVGFRRAPLPNKGIHITKDRVSGIFFAVRSTGGTLNLYRFDLKDLNDVIEILSDPDEHLNSAQVGWHPANYLVVVYNKGSDCFRILSFAFGKPGTWSSPMTIATGAKTPAIAIDEISGIEYHAVWDVATTTWKIYRYKVGESSPTYISDIVVVTDEAPAGLEIGPDAASTLVFTYYDGSDIQRLISTNRGKTWH